MFEELSATIPGILAGFIGGKMGVGMDKDLKAPQSEQNGNHEKELMDRRGFLLSLRKWSMVVIGGALFGGAMVRSERDANAAAWANRAGGGGAWANRVGGGGAWANRAGGGAVVAPGGAWANRVGGGGAWANRGAAWANRGGGWINRF